MALGKSSQLIESVFAGGGDMGARMRAYDWSATVLGPVEHWSQSLRACVRIALGAGHPMLISRGPGYTMLYNDAFGGVVGNKHPGARDHHRTNGRAGPSGIGRHSHQHARRDSSGH